MPRTREYVSAAPRQAAYRERQKERADTLRTALDRLADAILWASLSGYSLAQECEGATIESTLNKLAEHFENPYRRYVTHYGASEIENATDQDAASALPTRACCGTGGEPALPPSRAATTQSHALRNAEGGPLD